MDTQVSGKETAPAPSRRILSAMKWFVTLSVVAATLACHRMPVYGRAEHVKEIEQWRTDRLSRLQSESGWLTLVGLQWLNEGPNKVENPPGGFTVVLEKGKVTIEPDSRLTIDGKPVTVATTLVDDTADKGPTVVQIGTIRFNVIQRAGKYGLRVKDSNAVARLHFKGIPSFPISERWRVKARFERFDPPRHVPITNVLGQTTEEIAPGLLVFNLDGKEVKVEPILEQGEKDYFIIFKDATSGKETYPAARFVYAAPPDADGMTVIDFNKAYNPPCAFTAYATCPLPPPQNRFPFRVDAGEKKYSGPGAHQE